MLSTSAMTTSFAGDIIQATISLKQLCDKFKDVPDRIKWLLDQLEMLQPMVLDMEAMLVDSPDANVKSEAARLCIARCKEALDTLEKLSAELRVDLTSTNWPKRARAKAKAVMKHDRIQKYQERVGTAVQILMLCHQTYLASRSEQQLVTAVVKQLKRSEEEVTPSIDRDTSTHRRGRPVTDIWRMSSLLPWRAPNMLGRIRFGISTSSITNENITTSQFQLQPPSWLATTIWDVYFQQAQAGWRISLQPTVYFSPDEDFYGILGQGKSSELFQYLSERGQGLHWCDVDGHTILHLAIMFGRFDTAIGLVEAGVRLDQPDEFGFTPFTIGAWHATNNKRGRNKFFHYLAQKGMLEDFSEAVIPGSEIPVLKTTKWKDIELFDVILTIDDGCSSVLWNDVEWWCTSASTILTLIERHRFADFDNNRSDSTLNVRDVSSFVQRYFEPYRWIQNRISVDGPPADWRALCQLVCRCIAPTDLSVSLTDSGLTPLMNALAHCWPWFGLTQKQWRQKMQKILRFWLEDLEIAGIDLQAYGEREGAMLQPQARLLRLYAPRVARLVSGCKPTDWALDWDYFEPEYARDFWELVEWELPPLPGAWVDD